MKSNNYHYPDKFTMTAKIYHTREVSTTSTTIYDDSKSNEILARELSLLQHGQFIEIFTNNNTKK